MFRKFFFEEGGSPFAEANSDSGGFHQTLQCYRVPPVGLMVPPVPRSDVIVAVGVSGRASQRSVSGARNWMKNSSLPFISLKFYDYFSRAFFYHGVYVSTVVFFYDMISIFARSLQKLCPV